MWDFIGLDMTGGSNRKYERISLPNGGSAVRTTGTSRDENEAFIYLSRHLRSKGLRVPEVFEVSADGMSYVQEDLGDTVLYDAVSEGRRTGSYSASEVALLKKAVRSLPTLQILGAEGLDWDHCYPDREFNARMVDFDLNYFKYCFLKPSGAEFNEVRLQDDFDALRSDLLAVPSNVFMYRDFQARNVMLRDGEPWFIDFQGGRRGPAHYDLASFICQARSRFPRPLREELVDTYLESAQEALAEVSGSAGIETAGSLTAAGRAAGQVGESSVDFWSTVEMASTFEPEAFRATLPLFMLFRGLQTLGAYGFRGLVEGKKHFVESIPFALDGIRELISLHRPSGQSVSGHSDSGLSGLPASTHSGPALADRYPYLCEVLSGLSAPARYKAYPEGQLTVEIFSFSYKKGLPADDSGNGGGYVFDCRAIHNPGRYERFKNMTGRDPEVIRFLEDDGEVLMFLANVYALVDAHVDRFLQRGFTHMQVAFGCTGGQHRSVYCAEALARHLSGRPEASPSDSGARPRLVIQLTHREHG